MNKPLLVEYRPFLKDDVPWRPALLIAITAREDPLYVIIVQDPTDPQYGQVYEVPSPEIRVPFYTLPHDWPDIWSGS